MMTPSELLAKAPSGFFGSVFQKAEYETVFKNCLVICKRSNNDKYGLTKELYEEQRKIDGSYSVRESHIADQVLPYVKDYTSAISFSASGRQIHMEANKDKESSQ